MDDMCSVIAWSFAAFARGGMPTRRHDGSVCRQSDYQWRRQMNKATGVWAVVAAVRGDWAFYEEFLVSPNTTRGTEFASVPGADLIRFVVSGWRRLGGRTDSAFGRASTALRREAAKFRQHSAAPRCGQVMLCECGCMIWACASRWTSWALLWMCC